MFLNMTGTELALTSSMVKAHTETRRTISPYVLTSGDNPETLISKLLLHGHNYDEWSTNLRLALKARKKYGFADGSYLFRVKIQHTISLYMKIGSQIMLLSYPG